MTASPTQVAFQQFESILERDGVRAGLAKLVERTDYRYIGIFRFEGGKANAAVHYDRLNPDVLTAQEVPDTATYCCYVRDSGGTFTTANALVDPRLTEHPAREVVLSYCGVPVMESEGKVFGTLCHYDLVTRDPDQIDLDLVIQVASALAQRNAVPPYPTAAA
jgi:GAF domain-containing protein